MKPKLTPWYPPEIKPVYVGAYWVTHYTWIPNQNSFCYWDGVRWSESQYFSDIPCPDRNGFRFLDGAYQDKSWRGLARKPK